jgi:signal transduction histidine kinase
VASHASSTPSAAPGTSSGPSDAAAGAERERLGARPPGDGPFAAVGARLRRLPIRWRIAGGSAALTMVILLGFATIVGTLTTRRIESDFQRQVAAAATDLDSRLRVISTEITTGGVKSDPDLEDYALSAKAAIRIISSRGDVYEATRNAPDWGPPISRTLERDGWRIETRRHVLNALDVVYIQYGRRLSEVEATQARVRFFLGLGVVGGAALALLAGLSTAGRAMAPIAELTAAARRITQTRDPSTAIPKPESEDEVTELARTMEAMLAALDDAQEGTRATLDRQREFVADASHELRTPLTSILANLELLEETTEGERRETAAGALRSARRMRRLVADLLLLARADAGRAAPHVATDVGEVVKEAAAELEPVAGEHDIGVHVQPGAFVDGARDELHRLAVNLLENALRHTDPHTHVEASVATEDGYVVLAVEDDGPGIPPELREKVFERFFRGAGDRSGSSGLGLAIVRAVAESHHGSVTLVEPLDGRGARFVVRLPASRRH